MNKRIIAASAVVIGLCVLLMRPSEIPVPADSVRTVAVNSPQPPATSQNAASVFPTNCPEDRFWPERDNAWKCLMSGKDWQRSRQSCGSCVPKNPTVAAQTCIGKQVTGATRFARGCTSQQSVWFWKSACTGECFWNDEECIEKIQIALDFIQAAQMRGYKREVSSINIVTCDVEFISPDN